MKNNIASRTEKGYNGFLVSELIKLRLVGELKRSFFGWLWLILLPLISIVVWLLMKNANVLAPGDTKVSYVAFLLIGITLWGAFFDMYKSCSQIFANYSKILLVNKIPIQMIILSEFLIGLIKFAIPFVFVLLYYWISDVHLHHTSWLIIVFLIPYLLVGCSLGLIIGLLTSIAKDFSLLADNMMRFLMLLSPIVYDQDSASGPLAALLRYNPLTYLINNMRASLFDGNFERYAVTLYVTIGTVIVFLLVGRFFVVNTHRILERSEL